MLLRPSDPTARAGFTLLEILIVVVILGILAAIVIVQVVDAREDAERTAFMTCGRIFAEAAARYHLDNGVYPEDSGSGTLPDGFGDYITSNQWEGGTPIGGVWDSENNSFGITSAIGVHFQFGPAKDDAYMQQIDADIDDGVLATGGFRKIAGNRYYFIVAD